MKKLLIVLIVLLLLAGCSSGPDIAPLTKDIKTATEASNANAAAIKALATRVTALETENTALKAQLATINKTLGTLATKAEVAATFNNSPIPKEWVDVKATVNSASGQVAMLKSRQDVLENQVQLSLTNQQQQVVTPTWLAVNYATKGDFLVLQNQYTLLADLVSQLRAKLGM